ncbi:VWA domain-containing protein [Sphingorhabdus sp. Alg239-R122]|uniref:vWA domain-containing protein n=1 Tax=Sphingorhabdus sp. Alg239-R122 TaxID=2305989 RepID=UPI001F073A9A|nr:VWA domain-containing protein [Sphingorhabdus sp. Alg239-R122]
MSLLHKTAAGVSMVAITAVTVLTISGTDTSSAHAARSIAPPTADNPVNCSMFGHYNDVVMRAGKRQSGRAVPPPPVMAPPPPPPAPSAPAPQAEAAAEAMVVSGQRVTRPGIYPPRPYPRLQDRERYEGNEVASIQSVASAPVSTFGVDVDTGSYSNVRRFLNEGRVPPSSAVRTEEMINYFRYDYPRPESRDVPFSVTTNVSATPWNEDSRLMRVGLRGYDVAKDERPPANLVFLVDVSGSMSSQNKLPLVKSTLNMVADQLRADDRVSIVVYSGAVGTLLSPTNNKKHMKEAVACMNSGGGTRGGEALALAYKAARSSFMKGGINRIILATDGDFNLGVTGTPQILDMVEKNRESGVTLTTLGYGTGNYREELMEQIADAGNGNYAYIDSAMEAQKVLSDELSSTLFTIAKDVKIQVEFNPEHIKEYRLIGYENRALAEEDFDNDKIDAGDIGAGHQVTAIYEIMPAGTNGWLPRRRYPANQTEGKARVTSDFSGDLDREMAHVKLRYKLPGQDRSRLIDRTVPAAAMRGAGAPRGDMAFAVSVAAFGQKLRGDKYMGDYSFDDIRDLAGRQDVYWRQEFLRLAQLADSQSGD